MGPPFREEVTLLPSQPKGTLLSVTNTLIDRPGNKCTNKPTNSSTNILRVSQSVSISYIEVYIKTRYLRENIIVISMRSHMI